MLKNNNTFSLDVYCFPSHLFFLVFIFILLLFILIFFILLGFRVRLFSGSSSLLFMYHIMYFIHVDRQRSLTLSLTLSFTHSLYHSPTLLVLIRVTHSVHHPPTPITDSPSHSPTRPSLTELAHPHTNSFAHQLTRLLPCSVPRLISGSGWLRDTRRTLQPQS